MNDHRDTAEPPQNIHRDTAEPPQNDRKAAAQAAEHGATVPFLPMFLSSLAICFIVGWVVIFIVQPLFMKLLMKNMPAGGPGRPGGAGRPGGPGSAQGQTGENR